jgi:glutathione S-transferase/GNAT superfamily N-acetyltransferase
VIRIIGNTVSPYVRKILVILTMKGVPFEIDPIVPFFGDDDFSKLSPLRRIPVLIDGDVVVNDSSVVAQYLEETWPQPSVLPPTAAARAKARWLEEFADSRMGDVFVWRGFGAVVIAPAIFGKPRDLDAFKKLVDTEVVEVMTYLESVAPTEGFLAGPFGLADISIAVMFRSMRYARWTPDAARWPKAAAWLERAEGHPAMQLTAEWSDALVKTHPSQQRAKAIELGLNVTAKSHFTSKPRKGPMTTLADFAILDGGLDEPKVIALLKHHLATNHSIAPPESCHAFDVSRLKAEDVSFWSAWDGDMLLGVGAVKRLNADHGEVKSMHTVEASRGRGVGGALLEKIIAHARGAGMKRLSLETGSQDYFRPAHALYLRYGFAECPPFGEYKLDPNSLFMTRVI